MAENFGCSLNDITTCPSARIIKTLLKRLDKWIKSDHPESDNDRSSDSTFSVAQSLKSVFDEHNYTVTELINDFHHLKYGHNLNVDDERFDAAYDFFKDAITGKKCNLNECPLIQRHYRDRGKVSASDNTKITDQEDHQLNVMMDTMAMIHSYLLYSYDINRLTPNEREGVEMKMKHDIGLDDEDEKEAVDDDNEDLSHSKRLQMINLILTEKTRKLRNHRGDGRYRDVAEEKSSGDQLVDFVSMAQTVGVDEAALREELDEYQKDRDRLIGDLIDGVYTKDIGDTVIWKKVKMDDGKKEELFQNSLFGHFKNTDLSTTNLLKMSGYIVERKRLQINMDRVAEVLNGDDVDGRVFDKMDTVHHQNCGTFAKRFKGYTDCKLQHVRQLYNALKKWKYVEPKKEVVAMAEMKEEEENMVIIDASNDLDVDPALIGMVDSNHSHDVYEIGKRFYFWDSHQNHPDFIAPKYKNMKEEVMQNPHLSGLISISAWNALTASISTLLATNSALRLSSNGQSEYMYMLQESEPFDAPHLRSLKLYTDFTKLSAKFCAILRWANAGQIAGIAHWTRYLVETVQCFGKSLNDHPKAVFYRGVNRAFIFKMIATRFNLPLSTTTDVK